MRNRGFKVIAVIIGLVGLFALFQNCSSAMQFTAAGEVGEASNYQAPVTRSLTLSPITHKIENDEPIKFLFVVDDSGTMKNSQENLARSIASLGELLKDYNAEVMVVSTTCTNCVVASQQESTSNGLTTRILNRNLSPNLQKFSIAKSADAAEKERILSDLSNFILSLGTNGSVDETPLRSIAWVLDSQNFFQRGDNAIIYVLTDEDDKDSVTVGSRQYLKYEKIVKTVEKTIVVPAGNVPAVRWRREYYTGSYWTSSSSRPSCGPKDDLGNQECDEPEPSSILITNYYSSLSECEAAVSGKKSAKCEFTPRTNITALDQGETVAGQCSYYRGKYGSQIKLCEAGVKFVDADEDTVGGEIVTQESEYFLNLNPSAIKLQDSISKRLEEMFSGNYVLAAQVNIQGQNCALGQGQTYDRAFAQFQNLLPEGRFYRSSICEESALNGDTLRQIAVQLTVNITNNYLLDLEPSERILGLYVMMNGVKKQLIDGVDFVFSNDTLTLTKLRSTEIESMIVDIGQKENWKYQEGQ